MRPKNVDEITELRGLSLLVELPPRWKLFPGNLRAALSPHGQKSDIEKRLEYVAGRWIVASNLFQLVFGLAVIAIAPLIAARAPVVHFPLVVRDWQPDHSVVYYQATSLPEMEDPTASATAMGTGGGRELYHPVQTIRIARGPRMTKAVVDAPALLLPRTSLATANILTLPSRSMPSLAASAEIKNHETGTASRTRESQQPVPTYPVRTDLAELPASALPKLDYLPAPSRSTSEASSAESTASASQQAVIVSRIPGDAIAIPVAGISGTLAMSPHGLANGDANKDGRKTEPAQGTGLGSGPNAGNPASGNSGQGSPKDIAAGGREISLAGAGGSGNSKLGSGTIPGVTIRGGVVSLDSFGPKPVPYTTSGKGDNLPPRRPAPITVIATGRSGGGLNAYRAFKNQNVYTIYFGTKAGMVVLEFAAHEDSTTYNGALTPPDPIQTNLPLTTESSIVLAFELDTEGQVQHVRTIGRASRTSESVADAVRSWLFHPALSAGKPITVDALIGIGTARR